MYTDRRRVYLWRVCPWFREDKDRVVDRGTLHDSTGVLRPRPNHGTPTVRRLVVARAKKDRRARFRRCISFRPYRCQLKLCSRKGSSRYRHYYHGPGETIKSTLLMDMKRLVHNREEGVVLRKISLKTTNRSW